MKYLLFDPLWKKVANLCTRKLKQWNKVSYITKILSHIISSLKDAFEYKEKSESCLGEPNYRINQVRIGCSGIPKGQ